MPRRTLRRDARLWLPLLTCTWMSACGGVSPSPVANVVMFGDSLSDVGTYAAAAGYVGGGRFTTNPGPVWIETVARAYRLPITPNVVGWAGQQTTCPQPRCYGFAQGGARVTAPNGIGNEDGKGSGAMTLPIKGQIDSYVKQFKVFGATDLVFVSAGSNDIFYWNGAVAGKLLTADLATAQVQQAAVELAGYVKGLFDKGARHIYVVNLPDMSNNPYGKSQDAKTRALLQSLSQAYNASLKAELDKAGSGARWVDLYSMANDEQQSPAKYGLPAGLNLTQPACDVDKIKAVTGGQVTTGSSLFCVSATLVAAGASGGYLFADGVHPTTLGHKAISDYVLSVLRADGLPPPP